MPGPEIKISITDSAILISNRYNNWKRERLLFQLLPIGNRATAFNMQINFVLIRFWFLNWCEYHATNSFGFFNIICICVFFLYWAVYVEQQRDGASKSAATAQRRTIRTNIREWKKLSFRIMHQLREIMSIIRGFCCCLTFSPRHAFEPMDCQCESDSDSV